jgi:hypothetical protein
LSVLLPKSGSNGSGIHKPQKSDSQSDSVDLNPKPSQQPWDRDLGRGFIGSGSSGGASSGSAHVTKEFTDADIGSFVCGGSAGGGSAT